MKKLNGNIISLAYNTDIEDTSFPVANCALKALSDSEGFYLRAVPIDSTEQKKAGCSKQHDFPSLTYYLHTKMLLYFKELHLVV